MTGLRLGSRPMVLEHTFALSERPTGRLHDPCSMDNAQAPTPSIFLGSSWFDRSS
eukprot:CAMPEP_0202743570 /NCGR_PEP_ID=MMETSP1388-20130828/5906_1 /ASSEMBLY_ACC=CAM_ASM_000864 /TAXON_ID=37098 /ORGANISM="Isochrysis sp, Strain CCMP1244" /LENGTH=54 /DNA_ID=CAMNT_0049410605 /DNA_START=59 /DNA_END=219 /DNA_ORIENTATION=+